MSFVWKYAGNISFSVISHMQFDILNSFPACGSLNVQLNNKYLSSVAIPGSEQHPPILPLHTLKSAVVYKTGAW